MAAKPRTATAIENTTAPAAQDELLRDMMLAADVVEQALAGAVKHGLPLQMSIGLVSVEATVMGTVRHATADGKDEVLSEHFAAQAGLLLAAGRVARKVENDRYDAL